jgi:predicted RNase H-like HicB family nuclease
LKFTIRGQGYEIDRDQVLKAVKGNVPNPTDGRNKYFVVINGQQYPIKQLVHLVTGHPYIAFTAGDAYRILKKLEFDIHSFGENFGQRLTNTNGIDTLKFIITLERDEDGFFVASCPALPGCHSQGRTTEEAVSNVREAIRGYIISMRKHGEPIPAITEVQEVEVAV